MQPTEPPISSQEWLPVGAQDHESMEGGQQQLKTLEGGRWKWQRKYPGDGVTKSVFICNGHDNCKRELRVVKVDHIYMIQGRGKHSASPKGKKRVNSTLTVDQEKLLCFALDQGGRPAGIRVAMTKQKMKELEAAGADPFLNKEDMGGLIGALLSMMASIHPPKPSRYVSRMYSACILHVSRMFTACILITSEDTCIPHVSRMYPECIPHVSFISVWMHLRYMYLIMYLGCIPNGS